MHHTRLLYGLLAALSALVSADEVSDVTQLTSKNFEEFVTANGIVLAEFFAPWCGHCKALAPEFEEAATTLKEKDIKLVKIDCTEEAELCKSYGVEGYPTMKVFRGVGNVSPYNGQRKAAAMTSYMVKQSMPAVSVLTKDILEDFKSADNVVLVAYIAAGDKDSNETFTKVAEKLRDTYLFGAINDAAVAEADKVTQPSIVLYKKFDDGRSVYDGDKLDSVAIELFVKTAALPLVGEVGPDTYSGYMSAGLPLAYIFAETVEERTELANALRPVAEKYRGVVNFATIDAKAFGAHAANLNLKEDKWPAFAIQDVAKNLKFPYDQEKAITHDEIADYLAKFASGEVLPSIKSEPVPETQEGPVMVVVAKNYDQIVLDDTKDVLVEFYAPWCGHCKSLAPKYDELAAVYAASDFADKVVIAKVDATANDVPDEIQGFPTIKLFSAGSKREPITFSGAREVKDLLLFIKEHGKYKADVSIKEHGHDEPVATSHAAPEAHATGTHQEL